MASNLPMTITVLGGGLAFLWVGITDPQGGLAGLMGSVMKGNLPKPHRGGQAAADALGAAMAQAGSAAAGGGPYTGGTLGTTTLGSAESNAVVAAAAHYLGTPYVWGGGGASGPSSGGFDCSGLTQYAYHAAYGITIPRVAATQQAMAQIVPAAQAQPGDLVFFGAPAYHVGINLDGKTMIHAPHTGTVVKTEAISDVQPGPVQFGRYSKAVGLST
jgi:cell wall-associated NlpC family hydrolase